MKFLLFIMLCWTHLFAATGYSLTMGWHSIKNDYNDLNVSTISTTADVILTYKNDAWYGISPNEKYNQWLVDKNIEPLRTLDAGEAFWIFTPERMSIDLDGELVEMEEKEFHIKKGWNLMGAKGQYGQFIPSYYLNKPEIKSVWHYDDFTQKWAVYSSNEIIMNDIENDSSISTLEYISNSEAYWVQSSEDMNISIVDYPLFFKDEASSYRIDEKDMEAFKIELDDPNRDLVSITLSGEDADKFLENNSSRSVAFRVTNSKPQEHFSFTVTATDGTTTISKEISISINLRYENDYDGVYAQNVGYDSSEDVDKQWYLDADHLNIHEVHKSYNGSSANRPTIQVVEGGFDTEHEDVIANMDFSMAYDTSTNEEGNCTEKEGNATHSTSSAGIIAGRGYNGVGIRGMVPFGKLTGFKFARVYYDNRYVGLNTGGLSLAWAYGPRANDIDVSSNSWGNCNQFTLQDEKYLKYGSENLRDGKGRIYVIAAGNHRKEDSSCGKNSTNLNARLNSPYTIVVGGMGKDDTLYELSTPGANVFVSAYATDTIWTTHSSSLKYASFGGTSAAAPMVAGGIGLLLEACPSLNYRDVKNIVARTAIKVDATRSTWVTNSANLAYSTDYGFGKLNVAGAIAMCQNDYIPLETQVLFDSIENVNESIPHDGEALEIDVDVNASLKTEWVAMHLGDDIDNIGEYEFLLVSPQGTTIRLIEGNNSSKTINLYADEYDIETLHNGSVFRLSTVGFLGEESYGTWKIKIVDKNSENNQANRTLSRIRFQLLGY